MASQGNDTDRLQALIEFLDRSDVRDLFALTIQRPLTRELLSEMRLPEGLTLRQTEELLAAVHRLRAIRSSLPGAKGYTGWYILTGEILRFLNAIDRDCSVGSRIDKLINDREGERFFFKSLVDDAIEISLLDKLDIGPAHAREFLKMNRTPTNDAERTVRNIHRLLLKLPYLAGETITPEFVVALYEQVSEGVHAPCFVGSEMLEGPDGQRTSQEVLERLCEVASGENGSYFEHPAITALLLQWGIQYRKPLPRFNGSVARILFRIHTIKCGYPVLGYLPITGDLAKKGDGSDALALIARAVVPTATHLDRYRETDMTAGLSSYLGMIEQSLANLWTTIERSQEIDDMMRDLLQSDPSINGRQRTILARALRVPGATFRIRYHQTTHNVVYSTARADLMELEAKGYLRQTLEGKAFVFVPAEGLADRIDRCALESRGGSGG